jgi:hypothetical protein
MIELNYLTEVPSSCGVEDTNFAAFVEVTSFIGGCDVVEEFLACGLWPHGKQFCFRVETKESPLNKVMVSMPQITAAIREWESEAKFAARVKNVVNLLVGNYYIVEHKAYQGLRHGRLNRIFELARVLCQSRPEPIVRKRKSAATGVAPAQRKTSGKWGCGRRSSHSETQTSAQELALAKPLKHGTKFAAKSSGLSPAEKASITRVEAASKKTSSTSAAGGSMTRALNLFDSGSSASDDSTAPPEQPQKRSRETPLSEDVPKSLAVKGILE